MNNSKIPWHQLLKAVCASGCGITPSEFWNLTMPEIKALLIEQKGHKTGIARADLEYMLNNF